MIAHFGPPNWELSELAIMVVVFQGIHFRYTLKCGSFGQDIGFFFFVRIFPQFQPMPLLRLFIGVNKEATTTKALLKTREKPKRDENGALLW